MHRKGGDGESGELNELNWMNANKQLTPSTVELSEAILLLKLGERERERESLELN